MTQDDKRSNYRAAFVTASIACMILAAALATLLVRMKRASAPVRQEAHASHDAVVVRETDGAVPAIPKTATDSEVQLRSFQIAPERLERIGVKIGTVAMKAIGGEIRAYGNVQVNERRTSYVQPRFHGWIRKVFADASGDSIQKGQPLFTIYSPDMIGAQQEYLFAKDNAARLQQSAVGGVASGATAVLEAARNRLTQWDISPGDIDALEKTGKPISELTIYSPAGGYITERNALPNMYAQPETKLYAISDLSEVWVLAQVFQSDSGRIKPGDMAEVTVDSYPGRVFRGHVDYLLPQVDMATRTVPVRLVLENPDLQLKPGMYVNVTIKLPRIGQTVIPVSAAFHSGAKNLVFVYTGQGNIEPREVELGVQAGEEVSVQEGLKSGERIVVSANFLIDSEAELQAASGALSATSSEANVEGAANAAQQAGFEMTTDPSPARKGVNTVRIRLVSPDGSGIAGAEVEVMFYLPAMPAMGMASMKTAIKTTDKGGGIYEGKAELASGGTWQATVSARRNGQPIANKRMTLNVTGGM